MKQLRFSGAFALMVLITLLFQACSSNRDVISRGPIQKRKYTKGYHIDFAGKRKTPKHYDAEPSPTTTTRDDQAIEQPGILKPTEEFTSNAMPIAAPQVKQRIPEKEFKSKSNYPDGQTDLTSKSTRISRPARKRQLAEDPPDDGKDRKDTALFGILSISFAALGILLMLLGGFFLALAFFVAAIISGALGIKRKGKGFAIAGFALGIAGTIYLVVFFIVLILTIGELVG